MFKINDTVDVTQRFSTFSILFSDEVHFHPSGHETSKTAFIGMQWTWNVRVFHLKLLYWLQFDEVAETVFFFFCKILAHITLHPLLKKKQFILTKFLEVKLYADWALYLWHVLGLCSLPINCELPFWETLVTFKNNPKIGNKTWWNSSNTKKYHVFAPMGRFQLESIYLYFPPSSQLLYLCFCPVGLSLL